MTRLFLLYALVCFSASSAAGQKYFTKSGVVKFFSDSPLEKIEAVNSTGSAVMDVSSGKVEFAVLINAFQFEKALMQEHFNENYMESSKYPKAVFKGEIKDISTYNFENPGKFTMAVSGDMTIHGVTKSFTTPVDVTIDAKGLHAASKFVVLCSDYNIKIPALVKDNISNKIEVSLKATFQKLKK